MKFNEVEKLTSKEGGKGKDATPQNNEVVKDYKVINNTEKSMEENKKIGEEQQKIKNIFEFGVGKDADELAGKIGLERIKEMNIGDEISFRGASYDTTKEIIKGYKISKINLDTLTVDLEKEVGPGGVHTVENVKISDII